MRLKHSATCQPQILLAAFTAPGSFIKTRGLAATQLRTPHSALPLTSPPPPQIASDRTSTLRPFSSAQIFAPSPPRQKTGSPPPCHPQSSAGRRYENLPTAPPTPRSSASRPLRFPPVISGVPSPPLQAGLSPPESQTTANHPCSRPCSCSTKYSSSPTPDPRTPQMP